MRAIGIGRLSLVAIGVSLSLAIGGAEPATPDFSGRWAMEPAAPVAGAGRSGAAGGRGDMGSGWGSTLTITQSSKLLTVEYAFFGRGDMQAPLKFVYALDGSETRNPVMMGRGQQVQTSRTAWDGDKLVITTVHSFANPTSGNMMTTEVKQTLTLESPATLVVETARAGVFEGPPSTTRTVYKKL